MRSIWLLAGVSILLPAMIAATSPTSPIGRAIGIRRDVMVASPPAHGIRARIGSPVAKGDVITTGTGSAARIELLDTTNFSVGANASVRIDNFLYDADASASKVSIAIAKGAFRFVSGKPTHAYPGQTAITTPAASIGIRGTIVSGVVGPEALSLYEGKPQSVIAGADNAETATLIILEDAGEAGGGIDIVSRGVVTPLRRAGEALFFPARGAPPSRPFLSSPDQRRAVDRQAAPGNFTRDPGRQNPAGQNQNRPNSTGASNNGPNNNGFGGINGPGPQPGVPAGPPPAAQPPR